MKNIKILLKKKKTKKGKKACEICLNFSEEEKEKNRQYYHQSHKNLSKDKKQRLVEHRRNFYVTHKR